MHQPLKEHILLTQQSAAPEPAQARVHILGLFLYSQSRIARAVRWFIVFLGVVYGIAMLEPAIKALQPDVIYRKDFGSPYSLAKAILDRADPYTAPHPQLIKRYMHVDLKLDYPFPSAHPPTTGLLFIPLALLDYPTAATLWFWLEIVLLIIGVNLLGRGRNPKLLLSTSVLGVVLLAWYPISTDLFWGQLSILQFAILAGMLRAFVSGRTVLGGLLLGLSLAVKPFLWPLLLVFLFRRNWRALGASLLVLVLGYLVAVWDFGLPGIVIYFNQVLPDTAAGYRGAYQNMSLPSLSWQIFHGTSSLVPPSIIAPPLVESEALASIGSVLLPLLVLVLACLALMKQRNLESSLCMLICVSILISPISWIHYMVMALVPAAYVVHWLCAHRFPVEQTNWALGIAILMIIPDWVWLRLGSIISDRLSLPDSMLSLLLVNLGPALAMIGLAGLVFALNTSRDRTEYAVASSNVRFAIS